MNDPTHKRVPVDFRYDALNPQFIKMLAEIGSYAATKYGSWEQYAAGRLVGEKSPVNHIYEHLRQYQMGEPYDHFEGHVGRHLAAIAYNAMMEWHYLMTFGHVPHPLAPPIVDPNKVAGPCYLTGNVETPSADDLFERVFPPAASLKSASIQALIDELKSRKSFTQIHDVVLVDEPAEEASPATSPATPFNPVAVALATLLLRFEKERDTPHVRSNDNTNDYCWKLACKWTRQAIDDAAKAVPASPQATGNVETPSAGDLFERILGTP